MSTDVSIKHLSHRRDTLRLPAMTHITWMQDCLRHSPIQAVCLDRSLSQLELNRWLAACVAVGKPVFLRLPSCPDLPDRQNSLSWRLKRLIDWWVALLLLLSLSPLWLGLSLWIKVSSPGTILQRQWRLGRRGRLFQMLTFRTTQLPRSGRSSPGRLIPLGGWIRRSRLDHLPQLLNVLNGEMSLVGPRPWKPDRALDHPDLTRLNALPGMTSVWQVTRESLDSPEWLDSNLERPNLDCLKLDWQYLCNWSLTADLRLLTRATVRVLRELVTP